MSDNRQYFNILKKKQYISIINSKEYKMLLSQMCRKISNEAKNALNEATIENCFECELFAFFRNVFEPL